MTTTVRVGGVPEHFNLPWRLAIENGAFADLDVSVEWTDFPGGTGAIMNALAAGDIDAHVDQWYEFLATYHEGVLGWVGGVQRLEGAETEPDAIHHRLAIIRQSMHEIFQGKSNFQAIWTYFHLSRSA